MDDSMTLDPQTGKMTHSPEEIKRINEENDRLCNAAPLEGAEGPVPPVVVSDSLHVTVEEFLHELAGKNDSGDSDDASRVDDEPDGGAA